MKKTICLLFMLAIFLGACMVSIGASYEPLQHVPNADRPIGYSEYLDFKENNKLPKDFVYYEDLSFLGFLISLELYYDAQRSLQGYTYIIGENRLLDHFDEDGYLDGYNSVVDMEPVGYVLSVAYDSGCDPNMEFRGEYSCDSVLNELENGMNDQGFWWKEGGRTFSFSPFFEAYGDVRTLDGKSYYHVDLININYGSFSSRVQNDSIRVFKKSEKSSIIVDQEFLSEKYLNIFEEDFPEYDAFGYQLIHKETRTQALSLVVAATVNHRYVRNDCATVYEDFAAFRNDKTLGPFALNHLLDSLDFLGPLLRFEFDDTAVCETGTFVFGTPEPEVNVILKVEYVDGIPSLGSSYCENLSAWKPFELQEGFFKEGDFVDFRGKEFVLFAPNEIRYFKDRIEIYTSHSRSNPSGTGEKTSFYRKYTLTTSGVSMESLPLLHNGGGSFSRLLSAYNIYTVVQEFGDGCGFRQTLPSVEDSVCTTTDLPIDEGTDGVTDTANAEDLTGTAGNSAVTDQSPPTDDIDTSSTASDTPTDPAPFPWVWVAVPAAAALVCGGLAAAVVLIRRKKKSKS